MKFTLSEAKIGMAGRTPQGVRGLKFFYLHGISGGWKSHPARGAWIEIAPIWLDNLILIVAPRKGCVD